MVFVRARHSQCHMSGIDEGLIGGYYPRRIVGGASRTLYLGPSEVTAALAVVGPGSWSQSGIGNIRG
jgi:hypothetical protein